MAAPATFYILHGDDDFTLEGEVASLRARMGDAATGDLNTSEFDGETTGVAVILSAVSSYPFLADRRLVIVKGLLAWIGRKGAGDSGKKALETLAEALPTLPDWARLVFVERQALPDSNRILKLARELPTGYEKVFKAPTDSTGWIIKRAQEVYQAQIEPRAAAALASLVQSDLRRADHELVKLVSYVDGARPINEEDVGLLTPYLAEAKVFDMADALAEGRADAALRLLHRLLLEKDEDPLRVYGLIVRQFRLMLLTKEHLTGGSPATLAEALGVHKFVAQKLTGQTRPFSLSQLEGIYRSLLDYDIQMKTGRIEPKLALDLLVAGLGK